MSWNTLPTELHLAIVHLLPQPAIRALSCTSSSSRSLCLPAIFADVSLPSVASLVAFATHVPTCYGVYVRSLSICTKPAPGATGAPSTDIILAILDACSRVQVLSLSLASSIDPEKLVPAFARLSNVHSFEMGCAGTEDMTPVSERLAVALAASLPSLTHLGLSRITRSAIHVDPCDVPYGVPIVTNDFDVPAHPVLGSDLSLPHLLRLRTLRCLEIRDTWLGCDARIEIDPACSVEKLVVTGSMYSDIEAESRACMAWLHACPSLRSIELGTTLSPPLEPLGVARVSHVHINASRITADDIASTLDALKSCHVESISIAYEQEECHMDADGCPPEDEFARECAMDDLQDWSAAIDAFLRDHSKEEWDALSRVDVSFASGVCASWDV